MTDSLNVVQGTFQQDKLSPNLIICNIYTHNVIYSIIWCNIHTVILVLATYVYVFRAFYLITCMISFLLLYFCLSFLLFVFFLKWNGRDISSFPDSDSEKGAHLVPDQYLRPAPQHMRPKSTKIMNSVKILPADDFWLFALGRGFAFKNSQVKTATSLASPSPLDSKSKHTDEGNK